MISQPAMQNQLKNLMLFADDILYLRESPQFVRFLIGALVVEVFTEPWFATRPSSGASPNTRFFSCTARLRKLRDLGTVPLSPSGTQGNPDLTRSQ